jgi:hypothetical protein
VLVFANMLAPHRYNDIDEVAMDCSAISSRDIKSCVDIGR